LSLNNLKRRAKAATNNTPLPNWVSSKNISLIAYESINKLRDERLKYIAVHNQAKDYKKKTFYHISASEVARSINVATTTLISTSKYSVDLKGYLEEINQLLENAKEKKLETHCKTLSAGTKQHKKDEILQELQSTRAELEELKKRNATEQAKNILAVLSLPIKRKLGMDV